MRNRVLSLMLAGLGLSIVPYISAQHGHKAETVLYVWASDQAHKAPDFLAVVDFEPDSRTYGKVINTVPIPPPGNVGNEAHHCHLSVDQKVLGCGGLLSLLGGQNSIFFFDVASAKHPKFLFSANAVDSAITDDFLPLPGGGFLITQMGGRPPGDPTASLGGAPGRVAEFDGKLHFIANHFGNTSLFKEWPTSPPLDGFNPHGISARPDLNLMMTSDFILPTSTLTGTSGPVLRDTVRIWDFNARKIVKTVRATTPQNTAAQGLMDVKLLPGDPNGIGYTAGMFDGYLYMIDPRQNSATVAFDFSTVEQSNSASMPQILATPRSGNRLIASLFGSAQVVMLDTTDRANVKQLPGGVVTFEAGAGPHNIALTADDSRLVVADYFLNQDSAGVVHLEGDHKIRVLKVTHNTLKEDTRFNLDFDTAFSTGPARPHGIAMK